MKAVSTVEMARVVDPNTRVSLRVQTISKISPEAPDRKKQASTRARMGAAFITMARTRSLRAHGCDRRG